MRQIPCGKVATYGDIAEQVSSLSQSPRVTSRMVGQALHRNPDPNSIPCHRVVDRNGRIAKNFAFGEWREQKKRLLSEGVKFKNKMYVDLGECLWKG